MEEKIVAVSGGFDPIHIGHIRYIQEASKLGKVIIIANSDEFLLQKKGTIFMPLAERIEILMSIKGVDKVIPAVDKDDTVCESLRLLKPDIFAKGGDKTIDNTPEWEVCRELGIEIVFGVGGEKMQSSSWLVNKIRR
jgi:D-beta-D-heptose 7-phosphate kinase/D-beta-D-heptose 1-phosphate adenosyltransferase